MLVSGAGYLLGKTLSVDARSVGRVIFYIFSPTLIFNLVYKTELPLAEILRTMGFAVLVILLVAFLAFVAGLLMRLSRPVLMTLLLTAMFANTGNYGLPLITFAFGEAVAAHASLYVVATTIIFYSVGVLIASMGHLHFKEAVFALFKVPTVYAAFLGLALNQIDFHLPLPMERTVQLVANGSIPSMIALLGLQMTNARVYGNLRVVGVSVFIRLILGPVIGLGLASLFGMQGIARQANVVEASMPTAVATTVLATEYNLNPSLVTSIVFISTLLSPLTLTPLLVLLGR